jgi:hypothetical protein
MGSGMTPRPLPADRVGVRDPLGQREYRRTPMNQSPELIWLSVLCTYLLAIGLVCLVKHTRNRRALLALLAWLLSALFVFPAAQAETSPGPTSVEIILTWIPLMFVMILAVTLGCEVLIRPIARRIAERATRTVTTAPKGRFQFILRSLCLLATVCAIVLSICVTIPVLVLEFLFAVILSIVFALAPRNRIQDDRLPGPVVISAAGSLIGTLFASLLLPIDPLGDYAFGEFFRELTVLSSGVVVGVLLHRSARRCLWYRQYYRLR